MSTGTVLSFVVVGACWGCTTPFIKDGTSTADVTSDDSIPSADNVGQGENAARLTDDATASRLGRFGNMFGPLRTLASAKAAAPFLLNQSGSVLYYFLLSSQDISMAVPVCNSLTFVFTAATAMWLGEKAERPLRTIAGMVLVLVGIAICMFSKAM